MNVIEPEDNTFEAIMVDVTHRCNMECANCYLPNREIPDMNAEKLYDFCKRLPNRTYIRLIGAEPTMRDDIFDIIRNVRLLGHRVSLTTNGLKLHRKDYVQRLKDAGLKLVLLSMNGADDDEIYKKVDCGKYAQLKNRALKNLMDENFITNTGTIVLKNCNEHVIRRQYEILSQYSPKVKTVMRLRTVAPLGRYMGPDFIYEFDQFKNLVCEQLGITKRYMDQHTIGIKNNTSGIVFEMPKAIVRLVDWSVDDDGIPDSGNERRGRITEDFQIAPFFEHVKDNENGY